MSKTNDIASFNLVLRAQHLFQFRLLGRRRYHTDWRTSKSWPKYSSIFSLAVSNFPATFTEIFDVRNTVHGEMKGTMVNCRILLFKIICNIPISLTMFDSVSMVIYVYNYLVSRAL